MSQFDFPRIHFSGNCIIDPATANNNYHFPLVCYEPNTAKVVLPPRIYLVKEEHLKLIRFDFPQFENEIKTDEYHSSFLEISSINSPELFKSWMTTPLGSHESDSKYHLLYSNISTEKENKTLSGLHPGYWNYYGTMNFSFEKVKIHALQIKEKSKITNCSKAQDFPEKVKAFYGAELSFLNGLGKKNACIIDVSPALSVFTQIFADNLVISQKNTELFKGKPIKFSLRQMNPGRILSREGILASSGTFYSSFDINDEIRNNVLLEFFRQNNSTEKKVKGLCIRFDVYDLEEDQNPDYLRMGKNSNPAKASILGTLSPLYEGDLKSDNSARLLIPVKAFLGQHKFGSCFAQFEPEEKLISFDFIGSLPLFKDKSNQIYLAKNLDLRVNVMKGNATQQEIGYLQLGEENYGFEQFMHSGGIIDLPLELDDHKSEIDIQEHNLFVELEPEAKDNILVLRELPYILKTEQTGIYSEENEDPEKGFLSFNGEPSPCIIQVFLRGKKVDESIEALTFKLNPKAYSTGFHAESMEKLLIHSGMEFIPKDRLAGHYFYIFYPLDNNVVPVDHTNYMLISGNYINYRILPHYKYSYEEDSKTLNFQKIYNDFLIHYDLIYPASGIITPFLHENFVRIRRFLRKIMDQKSWGAYLYMPSTRDMPKGIRKMLFDWLDEQISQK